MSISPRTLGKVTEYGNYKSQIVGFCHSPRYFITRRLNKSTGEVEIFGDAKVTRSGSMRFRGFSVEQIARKAEAYITDVSFGKKDYRNLHLLPEDEWKF